MKISTLPFSNDVALGEERLIYWTNRKYHNLLALKVKTEQVTNE